MFQLTNEQRGFVVEQKHALDLSSLDYFLWGHIKEKVFQPEPSSVTALKQYEKSSHPSNKTVWLYLSEMIKNESTSLWTERW